MARFGRIRSRGRRFAARARSYGRRAFSRMPRRRSRRRRSYGGGKILGMFPRTVRLAGFRAPFLLIAGALAYFFVAPVKLAVNNFVQKLK